MLRFTRIFQQEVLVPASIPGQNLDLDCVRLGRIQRPLSVSSSTDGVINPERPLADITINSWTRDHVRFSWFCAEVYDRNVDGLSGFGWDDPGRVGGTTAFGIRRLTRDHSFLCVYLSWSGSGTIGINCHKITLILSLFLRFVNHRNKHVHVSVHTWPLVVTNYARYWWVLIYSVYTLTNYYHCMVHVYEMQNLPVKQLYCILRYLISTSRQSSFMFLSSSSRALITHSRRPEHHLSSSGSTSFVHPIKSFAFVMHSPISILP